MLACKAQTDIVYPNTELIVKTTVVGVPSSGVRVILFNNSSYYKTAIFNNASTNAVDSAVSVNAELTFKNLNPSINYWLMATWTDPVSKRTYNNINGYNYVYNKLSNGSETYITIDLQQSGSYIAFWTSDSTKLPITIVVGEDTFLLNTFSPQTPGIFDNTHYLKVNLNPSTVSFRAFNSQKQYYDIDTVSVINGQIKLKEILKPSSEVISFYYTGTNSNIYPITVVLDIGDTVGIINGPRSMPYNCGQSDTSNVISTIRSYGNHTYIATSKGGCSWQGLITANDSSACNIIQLPVNINCE